MEEFKQIIDFIQAGGFVGILIILSVPKLRNLIFNGNISTDEVAEKVVGNHLHEELAGIEKGINRIADKLDNIHEDIIYIKARQNGK